MRVVLVVTAFPEPSETFIVTKFAGLVARGLDVHVVCQIERPELWSTLPALVKAPELRERVHVAPSRSHPRAMAASGRGLARAALARPLGTARYGAELRRVRAGQLPAMVGTDGFIAALAPDVVHCEFGTLALERVRQPALSGAKLTLSLRGWDINSFGLGDPTTYAPVWSTVDAVHCLGQDLLRRARRRGLPESVPVSIIPPAVDTGFFVPPPAACAARARPLRILTAARLHWKKGHEHALAAVAAVRAGGVDLRYRIVGSGPHEAAVRAAIAHHGLEEVVEIHGTCPPEVVREHLWWADVVLHGATSEGFCNAVVEAQACGVPVVCTDADGLPENVAHGVSGLVVPRRDPAALAEALASLACDPCRRRELGAAGRERAVTLFGLDDHLDRWQAFFEALAP